MNDKVASPLQAADANAAVLSIGDAQAPAAAGSDSASAKTAKDMAPNRAAAAQELLGRVKGLPMGQKVLLGAGTLFFLLVILFTSMSGMKDDYRILFSNVDEKDSAAIVASLQ